MGGKSDSCFASLLDRGEMGSGRDPISLSFGLTSEPLVPWNSSNGLVDLKGAASPGDGRLFLPRETRGERRADILFLID